MVEVGLLQDPALLIWKNYTIEAKYNELNSLLRLIELQLIWFKDGARRQTFLMEPIMKWRLFSEEYIGEMITMI
jgi:hypothetical protein